MRGPEGEERAGGGSSAPASGGARARSASNPGVSGWPLGLVPAPEAEVSWLSRVDSELGADVEPVVLGGAPPGVDGLEISVPLITVRFDVGRSTRLIYTVHRPVSAWKPLT
jgi:hypothetical protein